MYNIIKAEPCRQSEVIKLYNDAREYFRQSGINQWQGKKPDGESFLSDVKNEESYIVEKDGKAAATFMFSVRPEPTYAQIYEGGWQISGPYAVIHRVAVCPVLKGKGIMSEVVSFCTENAVKKGMRALRCDTHADNLSMQKALLKNGFTYSGIIFLDEETKDARLAYEKPLAMRQHN